MQDYYADDLIPDQSLITLETADSILATTLHGRDWTARASADRQACFDDPERQPDRADDRSALRDASAILANQPWRGCKSRVDQSGPFPRVGIIDDSGKHYAGTPDAIQRATAILAAELIKQADEGLSPRLMKSYAIGESAGTFRDPSLDPLPAPVRQLITPFVHSGPSWSPVRP